MLDNTFLHDTFVGFWDAFLSFWVFVAITTYILWYFELVDPVPASVTSRLVAGKQLLVAQQPSSDLVAPLADPVIPVAEPPSPPPTPQPFWGGLVRPDANWRPPTFPPEEERPYIPQPFPSEILYPTRRRRPRWMMDIPSTATMATESLPAPASPVTFSPPSPVSVAPRRQEEAIPPTEDRHIGTILGPAQQIPVSPPAPQLSTPDFAVVQQAPQCTVEVLLSPELQFRACCQDFALLEPRLAEVMRWFLSVIEFLGDCRETGVGSLLFDSLEEAERRLALFQGMDLSAAGWHSILQEFWAMLQPHGYYLDQTYGEEIWRFASQVLNLGRRLGLQLPEMDMTPSVALLSAPSQQTDDVESMEDIHTSIPTITPTLPTVIHSVVLPQQAPTMDVFSAGAQHPPAPAPQMVSGPVFFLRQSQRPDGHQAPFPTDRLPAPPSPKANRAIPEPTIQPSGLAPPPPSAVEAIDLYTQNWSLSHEELLALTKQTWGWSDETLWTYSCLPDFDWEVLEENEDEATVCKDLSFVQGRLTGLGTPLKRATVILRLQGFAVDPSEFDPPIPPLLMRDMIRMFKDVKAMMAILEAAGNEPDWEDGEELEQVGDWIEALGFFVDHALQQETIVAKLKRAYGLQAWLELETEFRAACSRWIEY
ncbi:hypothetical protein BDV95DRAFT_556488 [Massariosphaeria phaeospora]|uniref:Uncharacterized protein n=1 Tax=Massariosphaeria phaeospora TaxID=100035 RepID=A0A7C8IJK3_9PLEO|nr:hypothetical protein BDV95DRAFT_556488 [Massariosphaeria phaeospora]